MLTKEIQHLNQQSKNHQTQIHKLLKETRDHISNKNDSVYKSVDHSIMLPNIDHDPNHNNSYSIPIDSVRNKLTNLNMSHDHAYGARNARGNSNNYNN